MSSLGVTLVTGATGLLGNNIVRLLLDRGQRARVLMRRDSSRQAITGLDVELAVGDVRDEVAVRQACEGVTAVIHCAAYVRIGWTHREVYEEINVGGTRHVAEACLRTGARMVHASTTDVFGGCSLEHATDESTPFGNGPLVPYVDSKRQAEGVVTAQIQQGLDAVIVNPAFMLGPWDWKPSSGKLLLAVSRGKVLLAPRGWLSFCDARDVAAGILAARDRGTAGRRYILAGRTLEWMDLFRLITDICGVRKPLARCGAFPLNVGGWGGDFYGKLTGTEPDVNSASVAMALLPKNYSSARASAELGYDNRPAEATVRDAWNWFHAHGYR